MGVFSFPVAARSCSNRAAADPDGAPEAAPCYGIYEDIYDHTHDDCGQTGAHKGLDAVLLRRWCGPLIP